MKRSSMIKWKSFGVLTLLLMTSQSAKASYTSSLDCQFKADKNSQIQFEVSDFENGKEKVAMVTYERGSQRSVKFAVLKKGTFSRIIESNSIILPLAENGADPGATESFDASLIAVAKVEGSKSVRFKGYLSIYDDGPAVRAIVCSMKK